MGSKLPTNIKIYKSLDEFDKNLPETVELLRTEEGDRVYLIGTAHFSLKSQDDVSLVVRNVRPDAIVLELCPLRVHVLHYDEETLLKEASELTSTKKREIIQEHGFSGGMFYISFLNMSANITRQLGVAPGGECRRAVAECALVENCKIMLGDRPINITMKRATAGMSMGQRLKLAMMLKQSAKSSERDKMTFEDVERYKSRDIQPLSGMRHRLPSVYSSFVTERDVVLAHSLLLAASIMSVLKTKGQPAKVVGVVGMGHLPGIIKNFGHTTTNQVAGLMTIPNTSWFGTSQSLIPGIFQKAGLIALRGVQGAKKMF